MIKSVFAATAALSMSAGAAFAGPYVNVETNAGWTGDDYTGAATDLHVGYEGPVGESAAWYVQGGPTIVSPDGAESETEFSGKVGASVAVTEQLGIYGELSAITTQQEFDDLNVGGKLGVKYSF
jgi:outer membrane autotransporter protein